MKKKHAQSNLLRTQSGLRLFPTNLCKHKIINIYLVCKLRFVAFLRLHSAVDPEN